MTPPPAPRPTDGLPTEPVMGAFNMPPVKACQHCYAVIFSACRTCPVCNGHLPRMAKP